MTCTFVFCSLISQIICRENIAPPLTPPPQKRERRQSYSPGKCLRLRKEVWRIIEEVMRGTYSIDEESNKVLKWKVIIWSLIQFNIFQNKHHWIWKNTINTFCHGKSLIFLHFLYGSPWYPSTPRFLQFFDLCCVFRDKKTWIEKSRECHNH